MSQPRLALILLVIAALPGFGAEPEVADVFVPKKDGFASIRIPSVVVSKKGTVLAFAEGRAADADQAKNKIVLKRSTDGGKTWGKVAVIAEDGDKALNNPCAVVEREGGQIMLVYQSYPAGVSERSGKIRPGYEGDLVVRNWLITSNDDGVTWSKPRDITKGTKREKVVTTVAGGPGIGIQLRNGKHAGRILMPFNEGPFGVWNIYAVYSDDKGKTWQMGEAAPGGLIGKDKKTSTVNEAQFVELKDGSIRFNVRRWAGKAVRKTCVSADGGKTWSKVEDAPDLADPGCMGSVLRYTDPADGGKSRILYSGPNSTRRENGTVFVSYDEGKTWPVKRVLNKGSFAYSCLTALKDGTIGCLYETDGTHRIVFARFTLDWLTEGKDKLTGLNPKPTPLEQIRPSKDKTHFVGSKTGKRFVVWGVNYDHDDAGRLLEDYWEKEWNTVVEDFKEIKSLGANVVRIHLQFGKFMDAADRANKANLERLGKLVRLAEATGLYLDVTGLGCYHKKDVPAWYDRLDETARWDAQSRFWQAVAGVCKGSPAVFCYDLLNEPVLAGDKKDNDWLAAPLGDKHYVQRITLDLAGRSREEVAKQWVKKLSDAIRKVDDRHMITVGVIPWAQVFKGARPLFYAPGVGDPLDFVSVHFYPKSKKIDDDLAALKVYEIGKPLVIEEIFPLGCSIEEAETFIDRSATHCDGWISFYWGKTIEEYEKGKDLKSALLAKWLRVFRDKGPGVLNSISNGSPTITTAFPGGNVRVDRYEGNSIHLAPDLRGDSPWFYWYFEAKANQPGSVRFVFPEKVAGFKNGAIGFQGPAISTDGGITWKWMGTETVKDNVLTYDFTRKGEAIRLAVTIPYVQTDLDTFLERHVRNPYLKKSVLTRSRGGREVELLQIGTPGPGKDALLLTARHHAAETIASYVLEGMIEKAMSDTPEGEDLRKRYVVYVVPFVDKDGVENGDQGKNRKPHDHNRDYGENSIYPEIQAIKKLHADQAFRYALDLHCPTLVMADHQVLHFLGDKSTPANNHVNVSMLAERIKSNLPKTAPAGPLVWLRDMAKPIPAFSYYFAAQKNVVMAATLEIPFAPPNKATDPASCRRYGQVILQAFLGSRFVSAIPKRAKYSAFTIPTIDLNEQKERQVVVDREKGQYLGHPTTLLLEDGKTILCVYPKGHGRGLILYKRSEDGGKTWSDRLPTPKNWETSLETPTIHRVVDAKGKKRIILFSGLYPCRMAVSEDDGKTWSELKAVGDWGGIVTMSSLIELKSGAGHYIAFFHDDGRFIKKGGKITSTSTVYKTTSTDGGLTWSNPEAIIASNKVFLCEPGAIRSPDGKQIAVLLRENFHQKNAHIIFSDDEGKTWTKPRELAASLNGDRHVAKYGPDGRLFVSFRDFPIKGQSSPTAGDWVGWIGTYDDLVKGKEGQYRIRLRRNYGNSTNSSIGDCGYAGVELLPDGTFFAVAYGHWDVVPGSKHPQHPDGRGQPPYVIGVRFTLTEVDKLVKKQPVKPANASLRGGFKLFDGKPTRLFFTGNPHHPTFGKEKLVELLDRYHKGKSPIRVDGLSDARKDPVTKKPIPPAKISELIRFLEPEIQAVQSKSEKFVALTYVIVEEPRTKKSFAWIKEAADGLEKYAKDAMARGVQRVFLAEMVRPDHIKGGVVANRFRLAGLQVFDALVARKVPGVERGPLLQAQLAQHKHFFRDDRHFSEAGKAYIGCLWFETLLKHDGLALPDWCKDEMNALLKAGKQP